MPPINANPHVSNAVLKGLTSGRSPNTLSNAEWSSIKKTALDQIKRSGNPKATEKTVKASLQMAKKASGDARIDAFIKKDLAEAVKDRQGELRRNPSVSSWSGSNTYRGRS